jgi:Raf kinase inhibitor-like YbhB/YbcL family protein
MNTRWLGRLLRGIRAGERHSILKHPALTSVPNVISVKSEWFHNGEAMPPRSAGAGVGENVSPPLTWSGVPAGTEEIAIIIEDPDAPLPRPFVHMIAYHIAPNNPMLVEGALNDKARDILFGKSTAGAQGYMGPRPVPGHGPHRYCFYVLALNRPVGTLIAPKLKAFLKNICGRTIGYGCLVGVYERD